MTNGQQHHAALPSGYELHWYEIESVLGQGGFGITYLAVDKNLEQKVAIKEFLPTDLAVRTPDRTVQPISGAQTETFSWGLGRFIEEAKTLAKFEHSNIVRVQAKRQMSTWKQNKLLPHHVRITINGDSRCHTT